MSTNGMGVEEKALGQRLQAARRQAGLTQQELCQKAGLSYSTLAKIERGAIKSPSVFTVAAIIESTGASFENLLELRPGGSDDKPAKKTSKTGVKFVYFDVNNVLVRHFEGGFTQASRELGAPVEAVENLFWRYNDELCSGRLTVNAFNKQMDSELGTNGFDWSKYYLNNVESMPGADKILRWTAQNYEVGLFSNHAGGLIKELINREIIPPVGFKVIVDSCESGKIKPETEIYKLAQEKAGYPAKEILLVDDTRGFLTAADRLGWQILWFNELEPADSVKRVQKYLEY